MWAGDILSSPQHCGKRGSKKNEMPFILGVDRFVLWHLWFWTRSLPAEALRWIEKAWERCQTTLPGRITLA